MNHFEDCLSVEKRAEEVLLPWLRSKGWRCFRLNGKSSQRIGDFLVTQSGITSGFFMELKAEVKETGFLFMETWSNYGLKEGWIFQTRCDYMFYFFIGSGTLIVIKWRPFKRWLLGNLRQFRSVAQKKTAQPNDTRGKLVPIGVVLRTGTAKKYRL